MGITFAGTTTGGDIPEIEDGVFPASFDKVTFEEHPDWAGTNQWGKEDDGNRFRFYFDVIDEGDVIPLDILTTTTLNIASKTTPRAVRILKALLTKAEYAKFEAGEGFDGDTLHGRKCQVEIEHSDKGWPKIVDVIAASKKG